MSDFKDPLFWSIAESSPETIMLVDTDRRLVFINRTATGFELDSVLGRDVISFVDEDQHPAMIRCFEKVRQTREVHTYPNELISPTGERTYWETRVSAVVVDDEVTGFVCFSADVTARRAMEAQLLQSQKMEAVGQLAGGIAHDFNNIVLAIMGNAEFARRRIDDPVVLEYIDHIDSACDRAADLTRQLLSFSRDHEMRQDHINVNDLMRGMRGMLERLLPATHDVELIEADETPYVLGDPVQLEQILINLCLNARDAMPSGGDIVVSSRTVVVGEDDDPLATAGAYVEFAVSDEGVGMSDEVQERAFEPFFTTKAVGMGTGLGLATCYAIAERHGGFLRLQSAPNAGTTVRVLLPSSEPPKMLPKLESEDRSERPVVLVAEDDEMVRRVVTSILEHEGFQVDAVETGQHAVRLVRTNPDRYACVIMDVVMPELGGVDAFRQMRELRDDLPAVLMSGYMDSVRGFAFEGSVLAKPFDAEELLREVARAIRQAERRE